MFGCTGLASRISSAGNPGASIGLRSYDSPDQLLMGLNAFISDPSSTWLVHLPFGSDNGRGTHLHFAVRACETGRQLPVWNRNRIRNRNRRLGSQEQSPKSVIMLCVPGVHIGTLIDSAKQIDDMRGCCWFFFEVITSRVAL